VETETSAHNLVCCRSIGCTLASPLHGWRYTRQWSADDV